MSGKPGRSGRKPLPESDRRSVRLGAFFLAEEAKWIREAARQSGLDCSVFCRQAIMWHAGLADESPKRKRKKKG